MIEKWGKEPDCINCMPSLLPENRVAWKIYNVCRGQLIIGMSGAVDINHLALWKAIEEYEVRERLKTFEKVSAVACHMIAFVRKEHEKEKELRGG